MGFNAAAVVANHATSEHLLGYSRIVRNFRTVGNRRRIASIMSIPAVRNNRTTDKETKVISFHPSHSGSSSSSFATMRFCSARGGKGIIADLTLSIFKLSTVEPDAFSVNWLYRYEDDNK